MSSAVQIPTSSALSKIAADDILIFSPFLETIRLTLCEMSAWLSPKKKKDPTKKKKKKKKNQNQDLKKKQTYSHSNFWIWLNVTENKRIK